jgi:hypothetical protein
MEAVEYFLMRLILAASMEDPTIHFLILEIFFQQIKQRENLLQRR